jgi:hypothetical protein
VNNSNYITHHIKDLLAIDKSDRLTWFNSNIMPLLTNRDPEAFIGFAYTGDFVDQLCNVALTSESVDTWWESIVGHQLIRSKEDIQHLNRLHKSRYNSQLQLQVNPSQLSSLNSKAPVPIHTMAELLPFIKRVWHCTLLFFPQCAIATLAQNIYKGVLEQWRYLEADLEWLSIKPGKIVYYFWRVADREFKHIIPYNDLLEGNLTSVYQPPSTSNIVAQCLSPSPTIAQSFLPSALCQRAVPPPVPQHIPNLHQPETNAHNGITDNEDYGGNNIDGQECGGTDDPNCQPPGPIVNP